MLRWLPAGILAVVCVAASTMVLGIAAPPSSEPSIAEGGRPTTPLLSLRRNLGPLREQAADHALREGLDRFVAAQPDDTCLRVEVDDIDYEHRTMDPQAPASLQKLLVAVAALTELGPDETYETDALSAPVAGGVVPGNLYLRGGGDPLLATTPYMARERNQPQTYTDIEQLADELVAAGVTTIAGSVVGDDTRYDAERYDPSLPDRLIAQGQVGPISALSVNDGFAFFPDQNGVFGAAPDPAAYAATVLDGALRARGVTIGGPPTSGVTPADAVVTASISSPPMSQVVAQMLRESDNNTAEMLLKEIGLQRSGEGSFSTGATSVVAILDEAGLDVDGVNVADGSGLSPGNVVTCDLVRDLLLHAPTADLVRSALPVSGETGTLARRWSGSGLEGDVQAKTGTLNRVTGLAGYAETDGGGTAVFALLVNLDSGAVTAETVAAQEELAETLVAHPDLPDVDHLRPG